MMELISKNERDHTICAIVYTCGQEDTQGDIVRDPDVLKSAAHDWLLQVSEGKAIFNVDHRKPIDGVKVIESYVTDDSPVMKAGKEIPPYSWVICAKVPERHWPKLKNCTGVSMQGTGGY